MLLGACECRTRLTVISRHSGCHEYGHRQIRSNPVYMTKRNEMYIGEEIGKIESYKNIDELLKKSQRVIMTNEDGKVF